MVHSPHPSGVRPRPPALTPAETVSGPSLATNAADDDVYDDEQDHDRCTDCAGTGWYIGFVERRYCPTCEGSGFL